MTRITRPRLPRPVTIRTLGDLGEQNQLVAHCPKCRHSRRLDLDALRRRYGLLSLRRVRARLRCTRCGARPPDLIHVYDNGAPFRWRRAKNEAIGGSCRPDGPLLGSLCVSHSDRG